MENPPKDPSGQFRWNNLWDIRPNVGVHIDPDGYEWRRIDIDQENFTIVDDGRVYLAYKDEDWFIDKDGEVVMIAGVDGPPWQFAYVRMADLLLGKRAIHRNGDPLDNRRCNLVPADEAPAPKPLSERRPSKPLAEFKPSTRKLTPLEVRFNREMAAWQKWQDDVASKKQLHGEAPEDPRMKAKYQRLL